MRPIRARLLTGIAVVMTGSIPVYAQTPERPAAEGEEIIVTAQKREQSLRDVPLAISAIQGDALDRATAPDLKEALRSVPGVVTDTNYNNGATLISVRGIQNTVAEGGSPTVGFYLDSVPFGGVKNGILPDASPYDLERVEVLRGPQGALYGAGSMVGLIRVLTHDPVLDAFDFKGRASVSDTRFGDISYRGDAAINLPIVTDKLAARVVVSYNDIGGWLDRPGNNDANDGTNATVRLKLKAQPTEELTLGASAWFSRLRLDMPPISGNGRTNRFGFDQPVATDYNIYNFKADYDFGSFVATSATSYVDYSTVSTLEYFGIFNIFDPVTGQQVFQTLTTSIGSKVFSQELTLSSTGDGPWQWTIGGMYRNAKDRYHQNRSGYLAPRLQRDTSRSIAFYGQLSRSLFDDRLEIAGGLRYFHDNVGTRELSRTSVVGGIPAGGLVKDNRTFNRLSPEATLTWKAAERVNLYARYAEGFRSGFTQEAQVYDQIPNPPSVKPDILRNYELGAKGDILGGVISFEAVLYYQKWDQIKAAELFNVGTASAPSYIQIFANGQSGSGLGAELGLTVRPARGLSLSGNFGWNDLTSDADIVSGAPGSPVTVRKGQRFVNSAKYNASASIDYGREINASGAEAYISGSMSYVSPKFSQVGSNPVKSDSLTVVNASVGLRTKRHWSIGVFVDNLTDENGAAYRAPFAPSGDWDSRLRPRTIGLQASYQY
jgi:outer membrane receptor protein involved in Fe transport